MSRTTPTDCPRYRAAPSTSISRGMIVRPRVSILSARAQAIVSSSLSESGIGILRDQLVERNAVNLDFAVESRDRQQAPLYHVRYAGDASAHVNRSRRD